MARTEQLEERPLAERVVKEAVERGLDSSLRDPIMEAVDESDAAPASSRRRWPIAGVLVGIGAAIGYAAAQSADLEEMTAPEIPEPIEETVEEPSVETPTEETDSSGSGLLRKVVIGLGLVAAVVLLRRRFGGSDEPEWEPIEEFEPDTEATGEFTGPAGTTDVDEEDLEEGETAEATDDEE